MTTAPDTRGSSRRRAARRREQRDEARDLVRDLLDAIIRDAWDDPVLEAAAEAVQRWAHEEATGGTP